MFRDNLTVLSQRVKKSKKKHFFLDFLTHEEGIATLCHHIGKELPLYAAWCPRRVQISSTSRQKSEITQSIRMSELLLYLPFPFFYSYLHIVLFNFSLSNDLVPLCFWRDGCGKDVTVWPWTVMSVVFWYVVPCGHVAFYRSFRAECSFNYTDNKAAGFHLNVDKVQPLNATWHPAT